VYAAKWHERKPASSFTRFCVARCDLPARPLSRPAWLIDEITALLGLMPSEREPLTATQMRAFPRCREFAASDGMPAIAGDYAERFEITRLDAFSRFIAP